MKILYILLMIHVSIVAQNRVLTEQSKLTIDGTSTLHDWTSIVEMFTAETDLFLEGDSIILNKLNFEATVTSIKSGNESMDDNTYEAMEAEDYPIINYKLTDVDNIEFSDGAFHLKTSGVLTVHGVEKPIIMDVVIKKNDENYSINGSKKFKMSDHGIEPPTMFLGTISTGDEITIKFNLLIMFNQEEQQ